MTLLRPIPSPGDVFERRAVFESWMGLVSSKRPKVTDVTTHDFATKSADSTPVKLRWYEKKGGAKGPRSSTSTAPA